LLLADPATRGADLYRVEKTIDGLRTTTLCVYFDFVLPLVGPTECWPVLGWDETEVRAFVTAKKPKNTKPRITSRK